VKFWWDKIWGSQGILGVEFQSRQFGGSQKVLDVSLWID
jgi:hypothetical protein